MSKKEKKSFIDISSNDVTKMVCAEYRRQINPYVVAYSEKKGADTPIKNTVPTNFVDAFIISIPLPTAEGELVEVTKEEKTFRELIGDRVYEQLNPTFTEEVCGALAKNNCKHCYNTGLQHFSVPERAKWAEACWCVKGNLDKMEKVAEGTKRAILGY